MLNWSEARDLSTCPSIPDVLNRQKGVYFSNTYKKGSEHSGKTYYHPVHHY